MHEGVEVAKEEKTPRGTDGLCTGYDGRGTTGKPMVESTEIEGKTQDTQRVSIKSRSLTASFL